MTKTTSHANCNHPATKSARATCRRQGVVAQTTVKDKIQKIADDYYSSTSETEEFAYAVVAVRTHHPKLEEAAAGYYSGDLEIEQMAALVLDALKDM
jgi:hypothetical protein